MLRKHEKFIKKWMLYFFAVALIVAIIVSFEAFILTLGGIFSMVMAMKFTHYHCDGMSAKDTKYKTAYKYYREIRRRLVFMDGYNANLILKDPREFVKGLNYRLLNLTKGENTLTSIDIATAIFHSIVSEDDDEVFMFDVFLGVMDKIMSPKRYKVSFEGDVFAIEEIMEFMPKADIENYIDDIGIQEFMTELKEMYEADHSPDNPYMWYVYGKSRI